jgi:hypothetical protein
MFNGQNSKTYVFNNLYSTTVVISSNVILVIQHRISKFVSEISGDRKREAYFRIKRSTSQQNRNCSHKGNITRFATFHTQTHNTSLCKAVCVRSKRSVLLTFSDIIFHLQPSSQQIHTHTHTHTHTYIYIDRDRETYSI